MKPEAPFRSWIWSMTSMGRLKPQVVTGTPLIFWLPSVEEIGMPRTEMNDDQPV